MLRSRKEPTADLEAHVRAIADEIAKQNEEVTSADEAQRNSLLNIPNLPHPQAALGQTADDNPVVRGVEREVSFSIFRRSATLIWRLRWKTNRF